MRALVIGGGHNGLVAGVLLARAGMEVTVAEAGSEPGGCIWTETLPSGHRLERGAVEHAGIAPLAAELGLAAHGLTFRTREVVAGAAFAGGDPLLFRRSADETAAGLGADGPAYTALARLAAGLFTLLGAFREPPTLTRLAAGLAELPGGDDLYRLLLSSSEAAAERRLRDPCLRSAVTAYGAHGQLPPWAPGTGMFALLLPAAHAEAPQRPVGGSAALTAALVAALEAAGGTLRTGAAVRRLHGPRAVLADGEDLAADVVVSTLDVRRTVALLDDPPAALVAAARAVGSGRFNVAELKVDLVLDGPPPLAPADALWVLQPDPGAARRMFADLLSGRLPERPAVLWTSPSPGVGWLSTVVPLHPARGPWTPALEDEATARALAAVEQVTGAALPGTAYVTGPAAWARRLGSQDGNPNHLDLSIDQLLGWRPGVRTALPWLYLSGAGTHPGGGLTGVPGRRAAQAVLADRAGRRRARRRSGVAALLAGLRLYRDLRRGG